MKKSLVYIVAASVLLVGVGLASAQTKSTTTTTTWTDAEGATIREESTTKKYTPVTDPSLKVTVGTELPSSVTLYPLPADIKVTDPDHYSYVIINDQPVVVERTTRKVVHIW